MRLPVLFLLLALLLPVTQAAADTLQVHFLYGSKPARGYKSLERHYFGGIHGGHVTVQIGSDIYGFSPSGRAHIFAHKKNYHSVFNREKHKNWARDTSGRQYLTVFIPVADSLADTLRKVFERWAENPPHDYAFIGMRCASTAYCGLSIIGLERNKSRAGMVLKYFYPKLLRKRLLRKARDHGWKTVFHRGRKSRKWERDG